MCQYCQKFGKNIVPSTAFSTKGVLVEGIGCIVPPTPVSKREHLEDELTATLSILVEGDSTMTSYRVDLPIKYCPYCGADLSK